MPERPIHVRLRAAAETQIRAGHPWIYSDSIRELSREGQPGELAVVFDRNDKLLALGFYDPASPIRIRVIHHGKPRAVDSDFWKERLEKSINLRAGLFDEKTTGFRWINGESDQWPALVLDRYADTLVVKLYSAIWFPAFARKAAFSIPSLLQERLAPERIVLRLSRNIEEAAKSFELSDGQVLSGPPLEGPVSFRENGITFEADVLRGQKTGFFLDQRENRKRVESLSHGRNALNAFSFSGGFSLYAARGGAASVTDLDISPHALESAKRNFTNNSGDKNISKCRHLTVKADAFEWVAAQKPNSFDLIILDPPSLAKRESERERALQAYAALAGNAMRLLPPGGSLVSASCSAHVSAEEFFGRIEAVANGTRRSFTILEKTTEAPDHPAIFPEAHYLKCLFLRFENSAR